MISFKGTYTAVITPFVKDENDNRKLNVDFPKFHELLFRQRDHSVDGIVVLGTTAESTSLDKEEKDRIIRLGRDVTRCFSKLIVGTGSNNTYETMKNTERAAMLGADAALVVAPYYVKPNVSGMVAHFEQVARVGLPIIAYNIPARTGVDLSLGDYTNVYNLPGVVGVKEASNNYETILNTLKIVKRNKEYMGLNFSVLSGNDDMNSFVLANGGDGVVSVISNILPGEVKRMVDTVLDSKKFNNFEFLGKISKMSMIDGNPVSIKFMMQKLGLIDDVACRLPLGPIDSKKAEILSEFIQNNKYRLK